MQGLASFQYLYIMRLSARGEPGTTPKSPVVGQFELSEYGIVLATAEMLT
jgi:hypothetical protein